MTKNKFLIIGMGSVGRNYLNILRENGSIVHYIDLVDKNINSEQIRRKDWDELDNYYTGIIHCNYAFQRLENFKNLKNISADFHIVEKLCFSSLSDIYYFQDSKNILDSNLKRSKLYTHLRWNILGVDQFLLKNQAELGEICGVHLLGGNLCFSMGGAHWIGLALSILPELKNPNTNIFADLNINKESPRAPEIEMMTGNFVIKNSERYISAGFDHNSHIGPKFIVNYQYGRIEMGLEGFVTKTRIPNKNYKSFQYDIPNESSTLFLDEFSINPFKKLIQSSMDGHGLDIDLGLLVSEMLIKLRIMYEKNIKVETAFAAETFENFKKERFLIT